MNLKTLLLTKNACYIAGKTIVPKGIMVHSTGANNPNLKRYVGPDDGLLGVNQYNNHWNQNNPDSRQVCVHGFIGKLADGSIATYQTLPWNHRGWHAGGIANNTHIGFEICEDGLTDGVYFRKIFQEAVELCAYLCKMYTLDPLKDGVIIGHYEGYKRGIASNHSDPSNWFPKHSESMDTFRSAVKKAMAGSAVTPGEPTPAPEPITPTPEPAAPNTDIKVGALVEVKAGSKNYYPGSKAIPAWVISDYNHKVTQVTSKDKAVIQGGKTCVLLGKKVPKKGGDEEAGINTWVDADVLTVVDSDKGVDTVYTVQKGDTLWGIAEKHLGSGTRYKEIQTLNDLTSDVIKTGQKLIIPE